MKNSYLISQQVPEFVSTKYPAFVEFIEAYYQWLEQEYNKPKLESLLDIEDTLSEFLKYFKKELDVFNILAKSDDRFLLKNIKQLYKAKGSEAAFRFFFKIVAGKDIQITYPWHNVLKVSDGVWNQNAALFIKITSGTPDLIVGKTVTISRGDSYNKLIIERFEPVEYIENNITKNYTDIYQFFVNKEYYNKIPSDARVSYENTFTGYTINTTTEVQIYNVGSGFKVGELYPIIDGEGSGSIFKILETLPNGGIKSIQLVKFGVGYKDSFSFSFLPHSIKNKLLVPSSVSKDNNTIDVTTHDSYNNIIERSHINTFDYNLAPIPAIPPSYAGQVLTSTYYDNVIDGEVNESFIATILINCNTVSKYPGYFENNNGFVSDTMFLQDNFYYQVYSYEISFDETLTNYKNLLLKTVHPSGLKVFGKQNIFNEINLSVDIQSALFKLENNLNSLVVVGDNAPVFNFTKYINDDDLFEPLDDVFLTLVKPFSHSIDNISDNVDFIKLDKSFSDSNSTTDNTVLSFLKNLTETQSINDTVSKSLLTNFSDNNDVVDAASLNLLKSIFDEVIFEDTLEPRIINPVSSSVGSSDNINYFFLDKYPNETITPTDNSILRFWTEFSDSQSVADSNILSFTTTFTDTQSVDDSIIITLAKSFTDTITTLDSGGSWLLQQSYIASEYIAEDYFESFTGSIN